jgi:hypothetical protein
MNFAQALEAFKEGNPVSRYSWNNKLFVFRQVPSIISKDIVPKMQSVPDAVKAVFQMKFDNPSEQVSDLHYIDQFAIVDSSLFIRGWAPSPADTLSEDWYIVSADPGPSKA